MGFASWDIAPKAYESINAEADAAYKVSKVFSSPTITTFKTSPDGIYDSSDSQALIMTGSITVDFSLRGEYLDELGYLSSTNTFSFTATLTPLSSTGVVTTASSAFLDFIDSTSIYADGEAITADETTSGDSLTHTVTLSIGDKDEIPLKFVYAIKESERGSIYAKCGKITIAFTAEVNKPTEVSE